LSHVTHVVFNVGSVSNGVHPGLSENLWHSNVNQEPKTQETKLKKSIGKVTWTFLKSKDFTHNFNRPDDSLALNYFSLLYAVQVSPILKKAIKMQLVIKITI